MQTNSKQKNMLAKLRRNWKMLLFVLQFMGRYKNQKLKNAKKPCSIEFRTLEHFCEK